MTQRLEPRFSLSVLVLLTGSLALAGCQGEREATQTAATSETPATTVSSPAADQPLQHSLAALPGLEAQVPELHRKSTIVMQTSAGELRIEVYPEAAPNAAARFVELVESGFYDNTPISRVVPGFVAQFGVNWREGHKDWQSRNFDDDPTLFALERGTLAFAKAGPNTNSTQVFINLNENNHLAAPQYNFTVFGKVVEGMDTVDAFRQVGDPSGGLDQGRLWGDGEAYLAELPVQPSMIENADTLDSAN